MIMQKTMKHEELSAGRGTLTLRKLALHVNNYNRGQSPIWNWTLCTSFHSHI